MWKICIKPFRYNLRTLNKKREAMKFQLTFKSPDVYDTLSGDLSEEELEEAKEFADEFVKYSEYIRVEFDTVAKTATILKV